MRVLFLIPYPWEGASSRYRVLQYVPHLEAQGIRCTVSSFLSPAFYRIVYRPGQWGRKLAHFAMSSSRRLWDVIRSGRYDVVFVHLEAFPIGPPLIERVLRLRRIPMVFDFDDAIFLPRSNPANPMIQWLRYPQKLPTILCGSACVITCNDYLRRYAEQFATHVSMIPTCVDVQQFRPLADRSSRRRPLIGWIGSHSTAAYLELLKPVLIRLARRHAFTFKIVGATQPFHLPGVDVIQEPWTLARDVQAFQELDIGVYPLPADPWVLGKTGFKTVQYMAVGAPCVVSAVGRNREIVEDGVNGFLASSEDAWVEKLGRLLDDPRLRTQLGEAGRKTVEERFAVHRYVASYVEILRASAGVRAGTGSPSCAKPGSARVPGGVESGGLEAPAGDPVRAA